MGKHGMHCHHEGKRANCHGWCMPMSEGRGQGGPRVVGGVGHHHGGWEEEEGGLGEACVGHIWREVVNGLGMGGGHPLTMLIPPLAPCWKISTQKFRFSHVRDAHIPTSVGKDYATYDAVYFIPGGGRAGGAEPPPRLRQTLPTAMNWGLSHCR